MADAVQDKPRPIEDEFCLLFYGNFVHDPTENELRVDMVKFSQPVRIREIRIIPKSARIHANLADADMIGRTTPSDLKLDFFVNDSDNVLAPYYEPFGKLKCSVEHFALKEDGSRNIWSDSLLIRGHYKMITVCVYGIPKVPASERNSPKPGSSLQSNIGAESKSPSKRKWPEDEGEKSSDAMLEDELFEPFSPDHSPTMFDIFDDDIGPPSKRVNASGYEEFSDDEIAFGDDDFDQEGDLDMYAHDIDLWFTSSVSFNPYQCNLLDEKMAGGQPDVLDLGRESQSPRREAVLYQQAMLKKPNVSPVKLLEILENAQQNLLVLLKESSESEQQDVVQTLGDRILSVLELDRVTDIPTGIDVRLIKAVLKTIDVICKSKTSAFKMLLDLKVIDVLVGLVCGDKLALSLKLEAVSVLGVMLQYIQGVEYFLGWNVPDEMRGSPAISLYQQVLKLCMTCKSAQLVASLKSLLKKVHVYEVIVSFENSVEKQIAHNVHLMEETNDAVKDFPEFDAIENTVCDHLNWCLKEIRDFIGEREDTHLPVLTVSSLDETLPGDNLNFSFINPWLTSRAFLECLLVLLASPSTMMLMFAPTKDILLILLTFPAGLQYLQDNLTVVGALVSHLYQEAKEEDIPYNTVPPLNDLLKNADSVVCCPHYVGILIVYYMKVLGLMLNVKQLLKAGVELDDSRCLSALHTLYSITLSQAGRHCVASVMSMEGYSSILMPFIEPTGEAGHDLKLQKQFLSTRYVLLLLLQLVQESNIPPFFIKHTNEIITVGQFFKDNPSSSLSSIHKWTVPLNFLVQHHSNPQLAITPLMEFIMEESSQQGSFKSSKSMQPLLMALKLTWFLVSSAQHKQKQDPSGIRALQSVLELVSCDGLERLVTLLQKAVDTWMPFWRHHLVPTVSSQRCLVATVTLNLSLLKAIYLEFTKDSTFQLLNSNLLKTLFSLHMVFCISPVARVFSQVSDEIEVLVVDILSLYSCSVQETTSEDKEYAQDSWNMLLRELICIHMPSSPQSTLNGLSLLSQLLPLPLPIEMPKGVSAGEICELHASRHKWEVHLKPFLDDLFTILKYYMGSCSPELHFIVREVMVKLADLSSALALSMSNCILGVLSESLADTQSNSENALSKQTTIQVLSTLTVVVQQPSMKQALCEALYFKQSKFGHILASLLKFLKFNDLPNAENVKIYIISFLNTLCDMNVAFQLDSAALSAQTVANNVPPQNWLFLIVESAWSLMSDLHQPFTVTICALKLLTSTAEYDQGIATLESVLKDDCLKFQLFVEHLISNLQAGGDTIKDVYQCTSFFLQFLLSLLFDIDSKRTQLHNASLSSNVPSTKLDGDTHADTNGSFSEDITSRELQEQYVKLEELKQIRSLTISAAWIRDALMPSDDKNFLQDLSVSVKEHCEDKQELSEFVQSVEEFVKSLSATIEERANTDIERVDQDMSSTFPGRAAIEEQFKERAFVVESSAGISSLDLWLTGPPVDEISFFDQCKVAVDLNQLAQDCCPNLNVEEEMKKQMLASPPHSPKHRFRKPKSNMLAERQRLRKEALLRQGPISGRGKDVFRSRKSTTSRAPSMHVDDFVKLGQQSRAAPSVGPYGLHPYMHGISGGPFMPSHLPTARSWSGIVPGQFRTQEIFLRVPQLTAGMRPGLR